MTSAAGQPQRQPLTTSAVAAASGYSVQQVRDLEALRVIPPAARAANGYREFSSEHVRALRAYRNLAEAIGPVQARSTLRDLPTLPPDEAAALVNSLHTRLAVERDDVLAAQRALRMIRAEAADEATPTSADTLTITELANALGIRTSTLRFWEKEGLIAPERVTTRVGAARRYPVPAIREARITATLRAAGYRIPDVRTAMRAIRELHDIEEPYRALENRVAAIARRTLALLRAGTDLAGVITAG